MAGTYASKPSRLHAVELLREYHNHPEIRPDANPSRDRPTVKQSPDTAPDRGYDNPHVQPPYIGGARLATIRRANWAGFAIPGAIGCSGPRVARQETRETTDRSEKTGRSPDSRVSNAGFANRLRLGASFPAVGRGSKLLADSGPENGGYEAMPRCVRTEPKSGKAPGPGAFRQVWRLRSTATVSNRRSVGRAGWASSSGERGQ